MLKLTVLYFIGPSAIFSKVHLESLNHICPFHFFIITFFEYKRF